MATESARFYFDNLASAAQGLLAVLLDARRADSNEYTFGGLSASQILLSGLWLEGEIAGVAAKLEQVPGAVRYDE